MRLAFTLIGTAAMCAWCMVVYAWTLEQLKRMRGQHITAQAALRRRIDRELDAIRARMDEELDRLWGHVHEEADDEPDLAWQDNPVTQPIVMPAPAGPATEPADQVLIAKWSEPIRQEHRGPEPWEWAEDVPHPVDSDDRKAQHEAWVTETLARYEYTGRNR